MSADPFEDPGTNERLRVVPPVTSDLDRLLAEFVRTREPELLAHVFERTSSELVRLAFDLVGDHVVAEDVVQDSFLSLLERGSGFDGRRPALPYLRGIVTFKAHRARRRMLRRRAERLTDQPATDGTPLDPIKLAETQRIVGIALEALPDLYREIVGLYVRHGLSSSQIAATLSRSPSTVRVQLHRGLVLLRRALPPGLAGIALLGLGLNDPAAAAPPPPSAPRAPASAKLAFIGLAVVLGVTASLMVIDVEPASITAQIESSRTADPSTKGQGPAAAAPRTRRDGSPVVAASGSLSLRLVWRSDRAPAGQVGVVVQQPPGRDVAFYGRFAATSADGVVRFTGLKPGRARVILDRGPELFVTIAEGLTQRTVELTGGVSVTGRVVDHEGRPAKAARLWLSGSAERWRGQVVATAGDDGRFELRGLRPGSQLGARSAGHSPAVLYEVRRAPKQRVELTLGDVGEPLTGRVCDHAGQPIANAIVLAGNLPRTRIALGSSVTFRQAYAPVRIRTDEHGRFTISDLPPGPLEVHARAPGRVTSRVVLEADSDRDVELTLARGTSLAGRVTTPGGEPIRAVVFAAGSAWHEWAEVLCAEDGTFELEGLNPSRIALAVEADGYRVARRVFTQAHRPPPDWTIALEPIQEIVGKLVTPNGDHDGWQVLVTGTADDRWTSRTPINVQADGSFHFRSDIESPRFRVRHRSRPLWTTITPNADFELEVPANLLADCRVSGSVLGVPRRCWSDAVLLVVGSDWLRPLAWSTNARSGTFEAGPLPPGTWHLQIHSRGGRFPAVDLGTCRTVPGETTVLRARQVAPGFLRFRFTTPSGPPRQIQAWLTDEHGMDIALRAPSGRRTLDAGRYHLSIAGVAFLPIRNREITIVAGQTTPVDLSLLAAKPRQIRFRLPHVTDVRNARARMWTSSGTEVLDDGVDDFPDGSAEIPIPLAPEHYTLEVQCDGKTFIGSFRVNGSELGAIEVPMVEKH